eukprot:scaffold227788_cov18-Tisochrysis_lutea.AAC.1
MSGQRTRKSEFQDCSDSKGNNAARRLVRCKAVLTIRAASAGRTAMARPTPTKLTVSCEAKANIIASPTPPVVCTTMMIMVWRKSLHEKPPNRHGTKSLSGLKQLRQDSASRKELPSSF